MLYKRFDITPVRRNDDRFAIPPRRNHNVGIGYLSHTGAPIKCSHRFGGRLV